MQTKTDFFLNDYKNSTKISFQTENLIQNKQISNFLQNRNVVKPIMENFWIVKFNLPSSAEYWKSVYNSIMVDLRSNKLKEYRFKLVNAILPCKQVLFKWHLTDNPLCEVCKVTENYDHLFIECPLVQQLWNCVEKTLKKCKISNSVKQLKYLVIGYKPDHMKYADLNHILSTVSFFNLQRVLSE